MIETKTITIKTDEILEIVGAIENNPISTYEDLFNYTLSKIEKYVEWSKACEQEIISCKENNLVFDTKNWYFGMFKEDRLELLQHKFNLSDKNIVTDNNGETTQVQFFKYSYQDLKKYLETETNEENINIINKLNELHNDNYLYDRDIKHIILHNHIKENIETLDRYIKEKGEVLEQIKYYESLLNIKENKMTKEQQAILEQDRKDTQEHIDSLSQEELDNIPVEEDLISDEELQEMQDSLDILLEQYTSNLDEIEKYKDVLRLNIDNDIYSKNITGNNIMTSEYTFYMIKFMIKQLNKENKILLEEIKSLEFDINYCTNN